MSTPVPSMTTVSRRMPGCHRQTRATSKMLWGVRCMIRMGQAPEIQSDKG
jgi:hypothetical protein